MMNAIFIYERFLKLYNVSNFLFLNSSDSGTFVENPPCRNQKYHFIQNCNLAFD